MERAYTQAALPELACWNVRMLECWNGGLEGLGGLESLEFRVLSSLPLATNH